MGIDRVFQNAALTGLGVSVASVYIAAIVAAGKSPTEQSVGWIELPQVVAAAPSTEPVPAAQPIKVARAFEPRAPFDVNALKDRFSAASFDLGAVRAADRPVPRLFIKRLPHDLKSVDQVSDLKRTFVKLVLPLALKVNEEIMAERHQLLLLQKQLSAGRALSDDEQQWLSALAERYDAPADDMAELLRRVDAISPALALAQSAEESGWGRSRFAVKGNALFGQRMWRDGLGMVPQRREQGRRHKVRAFPTLLDSVRSYARNLNGHPAYDDFRARRAAMRTRNEGFDPYRLSETLIAYSERREKYVRTILKILRINKLEEFENSRLARPPVKTAQATDRSTTR